MVYTRLWPTISLGGTGGGEGFAHGGVFYEIWNGVQLEGAGRGGVHILGALVARRWTTDHASLKGKSVCVFSGRECRRPAVPSLSLVVTQNRGHQLLFFGIFCHLRVFRHYYYCTCSLRIRSSQGIRGSSMVGRKERRRLGGVGARC